MSVNDTQIDGNHYKSMPYEPWDFIPDIGMSFILGCAVKYISRWETKNGITDIKKAIHHLDKAIERGDQVTRIDIGDIRLWAHNMECTLTFTEQLNRDEQTIVMCITQGYLNDAKKCCQGLIHKIEMDARLSKNA